MEDAIRVLHQIDEEGEAAYQARRAQRKAEEESRRASSNDTTATTTISSSRPPVKEPSSGAGPAQTSTDGDRSSTEY